MGASPRTKADCDREIASLERTVASKKQAYEFMKGHPTNYTKASIASAKADLEKWKGEIKRLKSLRKTLK